ncbi:MAG: hypothetical protein PWQ17_178 [Anaerophaga sp.]|nr:hypothetical protein [Anaerophaga sp.]
MHCVMPIKRLLLMVLFGVSIVGCGRTEKRTDAKDVEESLLEKDYINTYFPSEVKPAASKECFSGAYYRKIASSHDSWVGIEGKVVLPEIEFDSSRVNPEKPAQFMDNPSVYVGGNSAGQETDLGLTWEVIIDENGNVTDDRRAFRPFLRRTAFNPTGQKAIYENAPAVDSFYWYPGDTVTISLRLIEDRKLLFEVDGSRKTFRKNFQCDGYRYDVPAEYKRVNAIDQVGNEGKDVSPTRTVVKASTWLYTSLYRNFQDEILSVPMHQGRYTDMRCPNETYFDISCSGEDMKIGAETIVINGVGI